MRIVVQRVTGAELRIDGELFSSIGRGLMALVGIECGDTEEELQWMADKLAGLRVFDDAQGVMNLSVQETGSDIMAVSQFTLLASTRKGRRPSYIRAAAPAESAPLYERFCLMLEERLSRTVARGRFGADMQISLTNDGPVTIVIDSRMRD